MKTFFQLPYAVLAVGLVCLLLLPQFSSMYYLYLAMEILIVGLFAISTNILLGYCGLLSFGQSTYFGIGAYAVALLLKKAEFSLLSALLISSGLCGIIALFIGFLCIHLRSFYFAILTLAFSQMFYAIAYKWIGLTGGDDGIVGIPKPPIFGIELLPAASYYYFVLAVVVLSLAILYLIIKSPFGEVLQAIRDNEERAEFSGLNIKNYRLGAFVVAGVFAGVAGAIFAPFQGIVTPHLLQWSKSAEPLLISLLGGMHTFLGPMAGSVIFVLIKEWITQYTEYWMFWYGLLLVTLIIYLPGGIAGFLLQKTYSLRKVAR
ncbi:MAG: branched-chain amino acid ABC transporter permease [Desulfomonilaceae bacterium]